MHLVARRAVSADIEVAVDLCRSARTEEVTDRERGVWKTLWDQGFPFGVIVSDMETKESVDVGLLIATYIHDFMVEELHTALEPNAMQTVTTRARLGPNPFLTPAEVGLANANDGLNCLLCFMGWSGAVNDPDAAAFIRSVACTALLEKHGGNRHKLIIGEAHGASNAKLLLRSGFTKINSYDLWVGESKKSPEEAPVLAAITRDQALEIESVWLSRFFMYSTPRFHFTQHQREILLLARDGYTDTEIAAQVGANPDAIKKRWVGIYDRVNEVLPGLLPKNHSQGRGTEKRRILMAHLRAWPEELRPYKRRAAVSSRG